ncbi:hypothetical protein Bhyg_02185 [Pseudolycoriella hygida]|uniref:Uncharacterized protein n=1 Tax=Pseudolycoriella hygida TaxID=35572 RepID=A0A9Q0NAZ0_9DIPT|nr:hypothetical protein Bhyg_02185 [Pseudolycoriella hygida]
MMLELDLRALGAEQCMDKIKASIVAWKQQAFLHARFLIALDMHKGDDLVLFGPLAQLLNKEGLRYDFVEKQCIISKELASPVTNTMVENVERQVGQNTSTERHESVPPEEPVSSDDSAAGQY